MDMAEKLLAFDSRHPWGCGIGGGTTDGRRDACSTSMAVLSCLLHGFIPPTWSSGCFSSWRLRDLAFSLMQSNVENQRSCSIDVWHDHMEPRPLRHSLHASEAQTLKGKRGLLSAKLLH